MGPQVGAVGLGLCCVLDDCVAVPTPAFEGNFIRLCEWAAWIFHHVRGTAEFHDGAANGGILTGRQRDRCEWVRVHGQRVLWSQWRVLVIQQGLCGVYI